MDVMLEKGQYFSLQLKCLLIFAALMVGCREEPMRPMAQISIDNMSSVYDGVADSTTTTHTTIKIQDSSLFWKSVIDSIPQAGAVARVMPMFSFDTIIKIRIGMDKSLTIKYGASWAKALLVCYYDSADIELKRCSIREPVMDGIRERLREVISVSPRAALVHRTPGNATIVATAVESDSGMNAVDCFQDKMDSCIIIDTRIYPPTR